jgi:hypothetical protein
LNKDIGFLTSICFLAVKCYQCNCPIRRRQSKEKRSINDHEKDKTASDDENEKSAEIQFQYKRGTRSKKKN